MEKTGPTIFEFEQMGWVDEHKEPGAAPKLIAEAERQGARHKKLAQGHGGFYQQFTTMPAGFEVPMHSHDHDELLIVVAGGCTFWPEGPDHSIQLTERDSVALAANHAYAFICGAEGMDFYVIRQGDASVSRMD